MENIWYFGGTENFHTNLTWNGFWFLVCLAPFGECFMTNLQMICFGEYFRQMCWH